MAIFKDMARRLFDEKDLGYLDYFRSSHVDREWSGPFNGQKYRQQAFEAIYTKVPFSFVVETGTFRGVTTEYLASQGDVPVFSIESNRRNYGFARARLRRNKKIALYYGDSVQVLRQLFENDVFPEGAGLYYLDAHWDIHLPVKDEVRLIFKANTSAVVMIDDFEVPDDPGYFFDDYGESGSLTVDYLSETIGRLGLVGFFPSCPATQETGKKRGMIVLAKESAAVDLRGIDQLREYKRLFGDNEATDT